VEELCLIFQQKYQSDSFWQGIKTSYAGYNEMTVKAMHVTRSAQE
jgi:hypothetical protein